MFACANLAIKEMAIRAISWRNPVWILTSVMSMLAVNTTNLPDLFASAELDFKGMV